MIIEKRQNIRRAKPIYSKSSFMTHFDIFGNDKQKYDFDTQNDAHQMTINGSQTNPLNTEYDVTPPLVVYSYAFLLGILAYVVGSYCFFG